MMTELTNEIGIRTKLCPTCTVCGGERKFIYLKQKDRMFDAPGEWSLKRCTNEQCLLIWLDPMPVREYIAKAYAHYYTHTSQSSEGRAGAVKQIYLALKREYLARKYNYQFDSGLFSIPCIGQFLCRLPHCRTAAEGHVRFLSAVLRGRLLDVGCGSGDCLLSMRELGWDITGIDFDETAVKMDRQKDLTINCGALEQQNFPNDCFDAITLNHVIEHVSDPVETLRKCRPHTKAGWETRNIYTEWFKSWTPNFQRMLARVGATKISDIFTFQSVHQALRLTRIQKTSVPPQAVDSIIYKSYFLRRGWQGSLWECTVVGSFGFVHGFSA